MKEEKTMIWREHRIHLDAISKRREFVYNYNDRDTFDS
jgi:hypothetical protein